MLGRVAVIAGPSGSGKTERLLTGHREALRTGPIGGSLWISPTHRSAAEVRQRLLEGELRACFAPGVMTFDQFAEQVLAASERVVQPITDLIKRQILRRLIQRAVDAKGLKYFAPIAGTTGFVDLVAEFISELKRQEIWPDEFRKACGRDAQLKDGDLVAIYEAYQLHLNERQLYDGEGRFWTARELLREGQTRPFEALRHVVVDGFTEFTRPQHEILRILSDRVASLQVSLLMEAETDRPNLFAKPRAACQEMKRRLPNLAIETLDRLPRSAWPAQAHVEQELFKSPRLVRPAEDAAGIEVSEAGRVIDELNLVGRQIKQLLVQGDKRQGCKVSPADVAVVMRSPGALSTLLREVFDELGVPYALEQGTPLTQSPILAALIAVFRLHVEDWPFRGLLHLLGNNYFRPAWDIWSPGASVIRADRTIRSLQVARGRKALLTAVRRATSIADLNDFDARRRRDDARQTFPILERLAAAFDHLPARATISAWMDALTGLGKEIGLTAGIDFAATDDPFAQQDEAAWQMMREVLASVEKSMTPQGAAAEEFDAAGMFDLLSDVVQSGMLRSTINETGRVRVLSATSVRALSIPYLFFVGLSERAFPPPERADRLYAESDYERFAEAGLPLVLRADISQQEMLLFYEVITRARRRLHLSFPGLDEKGQPLLASPFLGELEEACGGKVERFRIDDLRPIPHRALAAGGTDQRILAVAHAAGIDVTRGAKDHAIDATGLLAGLATEPTRPLFENIEAGLAAIVSRADRVDFGPFEGMLGSAATRMLQADFGPQVRFSASRLEQYQQCPYRFFLSNVLSLRPVEELNVSIDPLSRGATLHEALARLHREVNSAVGRPVSPADPAAKAAFRDATEKLLAELELRAQDRAQPFQAALAEIERRQLRNWLEEYAGQHARYDALWSKLDEPLAPAYFEVSFGDERLSDDPLSTAEPLLLTDGKRQVLVRGRIDRVDLGRAGGKPVFGVLDYKSGSSARYGLAAIESGDALQVFLYALAAEQLLAREGSLPWAAGYWFIAGKGYPKAPPLPMHELRDDVPKLTELWQQVREADTSRVIAMVESIRAGRFPVFSRDDECTSFCDFATVCRVNQARATEKPWQPPPVPE
ncbi:MAG TPA: PD-(D/E)XK nuclease family protein [Pirellulales bacterium]|jgi:ATP-dependent helicase/DNAse subunit B